MTTRSPTREHQAHGARPAVAARLTCAASQETAGDEAGPHSGACYAASHHEMQAPIRPLPTKTRAKSLGPRRASLKKTTTPSMHAAPGADRTTPPSQTATADRHAAERRAARRLETARQAPAQRTLDRRRTSTHRTPAYGTLAAVQARPCRTSQTAPHGPAQSACPAAAADSPGHIRRHRSPDPATT